MLNNFYSKYFQPPFPALSNLTTSFSSPNILTFSPSQISYFSHSDLLPPLLPIFPFFPKPSFLFSSLRSILFFFFFLLSPPPSPPYSSLDIIFFFISYFLPSLPPTLLKGWKFNFFNVLPLIPFSPSPLCPSPFSLFPQPCYPLRSFGMSSLWLICSQRAKQGNTLFSFLPEPYPYLIIYLYQIIYFLSKQSFNKYEK